jgi:hypothetical protein
VPNPKVIGGLKPAFIFQNAFKQCRGLFNGSASSRLGISDQHLLHFPPSGPKAERFREIFIDQINRVSKGANNCG